jgi:protein tyrosine phosphatase
LGEFPLIFNVCHKIEETIIRNGDRSLFRERFKSEPVNDMAYFVTLLRYIHQNPLKAGIVTNVNDYEFSSWQEYCDKDGVLFPLCDTQTVLNRIPYNELNALVNEPFV